MENKSFEQKIALLEHQNHLLREAVEQGHNIRKKYKEAMHQLRDKDRDLKKLNLELEEKKAEVERNYEELKRVQEELIEAEKMASLGNLVAGVAHEVNTPLGISITSSSIIEEEVKNLNNLFENEELSEDDLKEFLENMFEGTKILNQNLAKAVKLIQSFKQISVDQSSEEKREFFIREYIDDIFIALKNQLKKSSVKVEINCPDNLKLNSFAGALSQVFTNLLQNALLHAFDEDKEAKIYINVKDLNGNIEIIFEDNGKGVDEKVKNRIFEPFITTKRNQGGSGLGLNIVYNLITQQLKGHIKLESSSSGTKFIIDIPKNL